MTTYERTTQYAHKNVFPWLSLAMVSLAVACLAVCPTTILAGATRPQAAVPESPPRLTDRMAFQLSLRTRLLVDTDEAATSDSLTACRRIWSSFTNDVSYAASTFWSDTKRIYTSPARLNKRSALWLGGILAVGGVIYAYDQEIFDAIKRNRHEFPLKQIVDAGEEIEWVGNGNVTIKWVIATMGASYLIGLDPLTSVTAEYLEAYYLTSSVRQIGLTLVGRTRPRIGEGPYNYVFDEGGSFPSGHMSNIMPLARILSHRVNHWAFTTVAYSLVAATGIQRITSDNHWPSDVYISAVYSWVIAEELLKRHWSPGVKVAPSNLGKKDTAGLILVWQF